ncbi:torsin-like protein [Achroia grisella]|uniref:torsin-like protein n=1 Tax=Achroia grisella TaxID=688607 RepID=UPI0027D2F8DB|nr:torsin-like protein [Achroia grisella]
MMHLKLNYILFSLCVLSTNNYVFSELITLTAIGAATAIGGASLFKWGPLIKDNTICRYMECCNEAYIPYDLEKLKQSFEQKLIGQPLAGELVNILRAHKEAMLDGSKPNKKALVISIHGLSGVGKNYASTLIAEALYKEGMHSKFVKVFMGSTDFDCTDVQKSREKFITIIRKMVNACRKPLIIIDEIHHMCPSVLDAIKPMVDHHHAVDGVDFRDSVFIFISNTGGKEIADNLLDLYVQGVKRNSVEFNQFEPTIRRIAYRQGGFEKAAIVAHHLIDHYIPFLPLEQYHIDLCAMAAFRDNGILQPTEEMLDDAFSVITYGPTESQPIFANNGCKRFTKHIPYVIEKHKQKNK